MLFFFNWEGKGEGVRKDEGGCHVEGGGEERLRGTSVC